MSKVGEVTAAEWDGTVEVHVAPGGVLLVLPDDAMPQCATGKVSLVLSSDAAWALSNHLEVAAQARVRALAA